MARPLDGQSQESSGSLSIRQIAQFENNTWVENIYVRSNGKLLVTTATGPYLYQIDPFGKDRSPQVVATFPDALGAFGVEELEDGVFAVTTGNYSLTSGVAAESFAVWKADLTGGSPAAVSPITAIPEAGMLNGLTLAQPGGQYLLVADSGGVLWRVDADSGAYDVVLNETAVQPLTPVTAGGFGINGVHVTDGLLYFTNTNRGFYRVPINPADATTTGSVEAITNVTGWDDFTMADNGDVYLSLGNYDEVSKLTASGTVSTLEYQTADASVLLEGNTAVQFGRTRCDKSTLYVTTNGGLTGLVDGTVPHGGMVLAIDLGLSKR